MPTFTVESRILDPYKNFKFRVKWDNRYVAGLTKMSALKRTTEVIEYRAAGENSVVRKLPGRSKYEPVTFERGLTQDKLFLNWANEVNNPIGDAGTSLKDFRKEVIVEVLNLEGAPVMAFTLQRCWVSEFQRLPEMDSNANAVAIEMLKIEYEGLVQDDAVTEQL